MTHPSFGADLVSDLFGPRADAVFDGPYRYTLGRRLSDQPDSARVCVFVLLNPSFASAEEDDPTTGAVCEFARRLGCAWVRIVNAYAWKETHPMKLWQASSAGSDIVGPWNDYFIQAACRSADAIVCGWGTHAQPERVQELMKLLSGHRVPPVALAINKDGSPKHPLYIKRTTTPVPYGVAV